MSEKKNYSKEQLKRGEDFARLIASYPKEKQRIILIAADAFMAGLSAKNATEDAPELLKKEGFGCINSGLVTIDPGESQARTVTEIIDDVITEICDSYCKYADGVAKEGYDQMLKKHCRNCPLNRM